MAKDWIATPDYVGSIPICPSILLLLLLLFTTPAHAVIDCDKIRDNDNIILACNMYHESRSEPEVCQWAIGLLTLHRVKSSLFPNTVSKVVWDVTSKNPEFSWTLDGKSDKIYEDEAWEFAQNLANILLDPDLILVDFLDKALYYHQAATCPKWYKDCTIIYTCGKHTFYR